MAAIPMYGKKTENYSSKNQESFKAKSLQIASGTRERLCFPNDGRRLTFNFLTANLRPNTFVWGKC